MAEKKRASRKKIFDCRENVWGEEEVKLPELNHEWLSEDTKRHLHATFNTGVTPPKSLVKKTSHVQATEIPHPGMSYNPSYNDHQSLLAEVAEKELKLMKDEKHLLRVTSMMFKKVWISLWKRDFVFGKI